MKRPKRHRVVLDLWGDALRAVEVYRLGVKARKGKLPRYDCAIRSILGNMVCEAHDPVCDYDQLVARVESLERQVQESLG